jgi:cardiolipin synthase
MIAIANDQTPDQNEFAQYFEQNALPHNQIEILRDGKSHYEKRMLMLKRAYRSIYIGTYVFEDDASSKEILDLLCEKAKKKVDVRLLLDSFGSKSGMTSKKSFAPVAKQLNKKCGIKVLFFNPMFWGLRHIAQAFHSKILVVDGREAIIGGSGFNDKYLIHSNESSVWHDLDVYLFGQSACYIHNQFNQIYAWSASHETDLQQARPDVYVGDWDVFDKKYGRLLYNCKPIPVGQSKILPVIGGPWRLGDKRPIMDVYKKVFKSSKKTIYLYAPFFAPTKSFSNMLIKAVKDGIDVRVITNSRQSTDDRESTTFSTFKSARHLLKNGVKVYAWGKKSTFHRKGGAFDGKWVYFGSDNLDRRGQNYSEEIVAFTDDAKFVAEFNQEFEYDLNNSQLLTIESVNKTLDSIGTAGKIEEFIVAPML